MPASDNRRPLTLTPTVEGEAGTTSRAVARGLAISPHKLNDFAKVVRGLHVEDALIQVRRLCIDGCVGPARPHAGRSSGRSLSGPCAGHPPCQPAAAQQAGCVGARRLAAELLRGLARPVALVQRRQEQSCAALTGPPCGAAPRPTSPPRSPAGPGLRRRRGGQPSCKMPANRPALRLPPARPRPAVRGVSQESGQAG